MIASHGSVTTRPALPPLRAVTAGTLVAGMSLALVPLLAGPAAAQSCAQTGNQVVCTFDFTGAAETFTVPSGVTQLQADVRGASGGAGAGDVNPGGTGGAGAEVTGTLTVTPGQTLQVNVGGAGGDAVETTPGTAGYNGGGGGGTSDSSSGGGAGGASDIRSGAFDLSSRLVTAAGGGGGGGTDELPGGPGGAGGQSGANGTTGTGAVDTTGGQGGGGATPTTPGAGGNGGVGVHFNGDNGQPGVLGTGGTGGGASISAGGGGGGGVYGGGGGGGGATTDVTFSGGGGGGGGSSAGPAGSTFTTGANTGNGRVTLTYTLPSPPSPVITHLKSHPNPSKKGQRVHVADLVCPTTNRPGLPRPTGTVRFTVDGNRVGTGVLKPARHNCGIATRTLKHLTIGVHTITATYSGDANYSSDIDNPERLTHIVKRCRHHGHAPIHGNHGCA